MGDAHYTELPPWGRAAYYRRMARETEALGETGSPEFRKSCREFSARWRLLANELMTSGFEEFDGYSEAMAGQEHRTRTGEPRSTPQQPEPQ